MTRPDTFLQSFTPPHALTCWVDTEYVYTAIPTKSGPPLIQKYSLTEGGLTKALTALKVQRRDLGAKHKTKTTVVAKRHQSDPRFNETQREKTRAVLRKMGIIPNS